MDMSGEERIAAPRRSECDLRDIGQIQRLLETVRPLLAAS